SINYNNFPPIGGFSKIEILNNKVKVILKDNDLPILAWLNYEKCNKSKILIYTSDLDGGWPMFLIASKDLAFQNFIKDMFKFLTSVKELDGIGLSNNIQKFNPHLSFLLKKYIITSRQVWLKRFYKNLKVPLILKPGQNKNNIFLENVRYWKNVLWLLTDLCKYKGNFDYAIRYNKKLLFLLSMMREKSEFQIYKAKLEKIYFQKAIEESDFYKSQIYLEKISKSYELFSKEVLDVDKSDSWEKYILGKEFSKSNHLIKFIFENLFNPYANEEIYQKFFKYNTLKGHGLVTKLKEKVVENKNTDFMDLFEDFMKYQFYFQSDYNNINFKIIMNSIFLRRIFQYLVISKLLNEANGFYEQLAVILYINNCELLNRSEIEKNFEKYNLLNQNKERDGNKISKHSIRRYLEQYLRSNKNLNGKELISYEKKEIGSYKDKDKKVFRYKYKLSKEGIGFIRKKINEIISNSMKLR
ncbi:MAG: hypothetical protein ACP6IY_20275, partial [Promethearchaeia archaeon]